MITESRDCAGSPILDDMEKFALELPAEFFVGGVGTFTVIRKGEYRLLARTLQSDLSY